MLKLTSIKILEPLYNEFKRNIVGRKMSLQKMLNRSMYLYVNDEKYCDSINECTDLIPSGSNL
jgi:7-cyano-7-deazaguanine synthase in queuosine biosynthesis